MELFDSLSFKCWEYSKLTKSNSVGAILICATLTCIGGSALACEQPVKLSRDKTRDLYKNYENGTIGLVIQEDKNTVYPLTKSSCYDATDFNGKAIDFYFNNKRTNIQEGNEEIHKYAAYVVIRTYAYSMADRPIIIDYHRNRSLSKTATDWVVATDSTVDRNSVLGTSAFVTQRGIVRSNDRSNVKLTEISDAPQAMRDILLDDNSIWPALVAIVEEDTARVMENPRLHENTVFFPIKDVQTISGGTTTINLFLTKYSDSIDPRWESFLTVRTAGVECLYLKYALPDRDSVLVGGTLGKDYLILKMNETAQCITE